MKLFINSKKKFITLLYQKMIQIQSELFISNKNKNFLNIIKYKFIKIY
jgi:hypothetical protein